MDKRTPIYILPICVAATLWFFMFSPWTGHMFNFWYMMSIAACTLTVMAVLSMKLNGMRIIADGDTSLRGIPLHIILGIVLACLLWGIFWTGDKLASALFDFARRQVDNVYAMKSGEGDIPIGILLLCLIGPAEEFFWRGFVQRTMASHLSAKYGDGKGANGAFIFTLLIYTGIHIWSFNFMLIAAAFVAGFFWGLIYRLKPKMLPALIVSHAVWDALVFVIFPI